MAHHNISNDAIVYRKGVVLPPKAECNKSHQHVVHTLTGNFVLYAIYLTCLIKKVFKTSHVRVNYALRNTLVPQVDSAVLNNRYQIMGKLTFSDLYLGLVIQL